MNIGAMMAQAKKMQAEMEKAKEKLAAKDFTVEKQGITVVMSGDRKLKKVDINEILVDPDDKETLEAMIIIAVNEVIELIEEEQEKIDKPNSSMPGMPF